MFKAYVAQLYYIKKITFRWWMETNIFRPLNPYDFLYFNLYNVENPGADNKPLKEDKS